MTTPEDAPAARSYLFVPGDRPDRFDAAWRSDADAVIVDLEDAVPPAAKAAARDALARWADASRPVWVRVNAEDTPWHDDDVAAVAAMPGALGVVLPKAERVGDAVARLADATGRGAIALVETARGLLQAGALAAHPAVRRLAFGTIDFSLDTGLGEEGLDACRVQLALHSRAAGRPAPVDGVCTETVDAAAVRAHAVRGRRLGCGAVLCIHPRQVAPVHEALSPTDDERRWAQEVLDALRASGGSAVAVRGRMVDRPVGLAAARILATPAAGAPSPRLGTG